MRIAQINMLHFGSTGKIMFSLAEVARESGDEVLTFSPRCYRKGMGDHFPQIDGHVYFGSWAENMLHHHIAKITGLNGCFSFWGTKELIRELENFNPDIVHLHNLHNWSFNLALLFDYLKKSGVRVIWTLHDTWSFTGYCPYFNVSGCVKWKTECGKCPQTREYPGTYLDTSRLMYHLKKKWFTGVKHMTLVTPSRWLASLVQQSYLRNYPVQVINNGIDLEIFRPRQSDFRDKHGIDQKKFMLLGVAFGWGNRKGLDVFVELSKKLDVEQYQIVLVGTDDYVDEKLTPNIISVHRTQNQFELAEIYTAADLFVNPTREDNYPTVNMESLACGTPVITFRTGGSPEIVSERTGAVVDCDDVMSLEREIKRIRSEQPYSRQSCLEYAQNFNMYLRFREYLDLYSLHDTIEYSGA